ncbi:MAG: aminotransferase class I/II-fold pyridoxal phosphate-dependent enzyme [Thermoleophilia bacterium]|nr:aminotransferase class I/II-fold pyridoxal phosphate-dependent enzyme [Thermoleophilia bacterium]
MKTDTRAVHAGRGDLAALGVHAPPIDLSSTYPMPSLEEAIADIDTLAAGGGSPDSPVYARLHNPTVARFEDALATLERTDEAVAFSSGMAALTATLLATSEERRHVVAFRPLYGGSDHLLASGLLGLDVTWIRDVAELGRALRAETGLVLLETPQNPTLDVIDIEAVVAGADGVPVLVDNTFATPVLQNPALHGASYVLHSATKFLGGHGDVLAGIVATGAERAARLRQVRILTGAVLHPVAAYLLHRSLPTLPGRVRAAQATAATLAGRLRGHPMVTRVLYPEADGRQLRGPGAIVAFEVEGGFEAAARVVEALELVTPAVSLGSTETLIQHPAGLTHRLLDAELKQDLGITDGLLRLSVGLEDVDDLWGDLVQALASVRVDAAV